MTAGNKPLGEPTGKKALSAATLASAPSEVLDFLLPLWAGSALGGAGGALFWVGLRTWVGPRTATDGHGPRSSGYGKLLSAEGQGASVGYLVALALLDRGGHALLFWVGAAACATAAAEAGLWMLFCCDSRSNSASGPWRSCRASSSSSWRPSTPAGH